MPKNYGRNLPVWVSQNFLTSRGIIERLLRLTNINRTDHVIEIGPGKGHITAVLQRYCRNVSAIEIDHKLYNRLQDKLEGNVKLYCQDFMTWQLPNDGEYKVFANIPFNRTTDILRKLTECRNPPTEAWLVMEKGAAKRFMGNVHETLASLLIKPFFDTSIKYHFRREDFHPAPKVDVVLFHLSRKNSPDIAPDERRMYKRFMENCFARPSKLYNLLTHRQVAKALAMESLSREDIRKGNMLYVQWLCLFRCYMKFGRK